MKLTLSPALLMIALLAVALGAQLYLPTGITVSLAALVYILYTRSLRQSALTLRLLPYLVVVMLASVVKIPAPTAWPALPRLLLVIGLWTALCLLGTYLSERHLSSRGTGAGT